MSSGDRVSLVILGLCTELLALLFMILDFERETGKDGRLKVN